MARFLALLCLALALISRPASAVDDGTWKVQFPASKPMVQELQGGVLDPVRSRMIFFGGSDGEVALRMTRALSLSNPQTWSVLSSSGPSARYEHTLVYDSARDRVLLFGGRDASGARFADVWALSLAGTPAWTLLVAAGVPPSARSGHEAIYDPIRDRMLVIAGYDGQYRNDTWALSLTGTPTWSALTPSGSPPMARRYAAAVYEPAGDRVLLIGGERSDNVLPPAESNDTWALSLGGSPAWTQLAPLGTPPTARLVHEAVYDGLAQRVLVFGGSELGRFWKNDLWALNLSDPPAWDSLATTGTKPRTRAGHSMVLYPPTNSAFIFGGRDSAFVLSSASVLELSSFPQRWTPLPRLGPAIPGDRMGHEGVYDPLRRRFVVFGGYDYGTFHRNDLWAYGLDGPPTWTRLDTSAPRPDIRHSYAMIGQPSADRLILFGGQNFTGYFGDLWTFNFATATWAPLSASGTPPSPRVVSAALYDAPRDRMLLVGGLTVGAIPKNEVWSLTLGGAPAWSLLAPSGTPPSPRYGPAITHDTVRDRLILYGGFDNNTFYGDLWTLDLSGAPAWAPLATTGTGPGPAYGHEMIYDPVGDRVLVIAGFTGSGFSRLVYALDLAASPAAWSLLSPAGDVLPKRDFFASMYDPVLDRLVIEGGNSSDGSFTLDDVWSLDWSRVPTPALLSLAEESIVPGAVTLTWFSPDGGGQRATVHRRTEESDWQEIGALESDASGRFVLEDRIASGGRFAYRLAAAGGFTEAHWVTIPGTLAFALEGAWPNPSAGSMQVRFRLPDAQAASLELVDVRGRRVFRRDVLGAGSHVVDLGGETKLAPGVYVIRLVQGDRAQRLKVAVVR